MSKVLSLALKTAEDSAFTLGTTSQPALSALSDSLMWYWRIFIRWNFKECGDEFPILFRQPGKRIKVGKCDLSSRFVHRKYFIIALRRMFLILTILHQVKKVVCRVVLEAKVVASMWLNSGPIICLGPKPISVLSEFRSKKYLLLCLRGLFHHSWLKWWNIHLEVGSCV